MRIVVVGAGGLVGGAVVRAASRRGAAVTALARWQCDVERATDRDRVLGELRPDAVILCAAATHVDEAGPGTRGVNVDAPVAWARRVETWFLSSNFVFDGPGPHPPSEAPRPLNPYAEQKVEAEQGVLAAGGHVVRVGWVYGPGGRTFASMLPERLASGQPVRALCDVLVQPTHADDVAAELLALPRGISHLASSAPTTWYGFALAYAARLGGRVEPVRLAQFGLGPRPRAARLEPATLPPWTERLPSWAAG